MGTRYSPKRLSPEEDAGLFDRLFSGGRPLPQPGEDYSLYVLPVDAQEITPEDRERFPPILLGDEKAARDWLDRALELDDKTERKAVTPEERKKKRRQFWGDILFYVALAVFVLGVFLIRGSKDGTPTTFMGFSALRVLTGSMEREIPQGSLIVTRSVDPETLEIGDDITYLSGVNNTVTHRIVDIMENYAGTGQRAFTTQGIMNDSPDSEPVPAANVVGKVIFHNLTLGKLLYFIRQYWAWLVALAAMLVGLAQCLKIVFRESKRERALDQRPGKRAVGRRAQVTNGSEM